MEDGVALITWKITERRRCSGKYFLCSCYNVVRTIMIVVLHSSSQLFTFSTLNTNLYVFCFFNVLERTRWPRFPIPGFQAP
jgi:hypothetical protein